MGARSASSVANIFLAHLESTEVFKDRPQLICYRCFIDDLLLIWEGDEESIHIFMNKLNTNNKNISLSWQYDRSRILFLDLEIKVDNDHICTIISVQ